MLIEIASPIFKCAEDENIFFLRLYKLPDFDGVINKGRKVSLTLTDIFNDAAFEELQIICDIWDTSFNVLKNDAF